MKFVMQRLSRLAAVIVGKRDARSLWFPLVIAVLGLLLPALSNAAGAETRQSLILNREWKFLIGEQTGAGGMAYDDSAWSRINLPHSFSLPYFAATDRFYVGVGWYRKALDVPDAWLNKRVTLDFEGAFQETEVYLNGDLVGSHRGGYTGFEIDLSKGLRAGSNTLAIRVSNRWDAQLAPRAGEHHFSGGIYRNVRLIVTDKLHVAWYGTSVTTPQATEAAATVNVKTEVANDDAHARVATVRNSIVDADGAVLATLESTQTVDAGKTVTFDQTSKSIDRPKLWSPEQPYLYTVKTEVLEGSNPCDQYTSPLGIRWFNFTADKGFFFNGKHRYFRGANVHQDQAGWGDAVTNAAMRRDVQMMKDAGFDFIRGSHYPHAPSFTDACDRLGILFWSENAFWGTGGFRGDGFWDCSAYPVKAEDRAGFEASVKQSLRDMIRIHRNHPSVVVWSMSNEPFFSDDHVMPEVRRFLKELVALTHELDPTRPAAIGGAQRGEIDRLGDIAGYNGDGARLNEYQNPGVPNVVSEYGSGINDRPGDYSKSWGELEQTPNTNGTGAYPWRLPWRSGEIIWCGFDHGSIAGRKFGAMGLVDYYRLPKRQWFWYRNEYLGITPPEWPKQGKPAGLTLKADKTELQQADGTDDCQVVVTVVDSAGTALSNNVPATLTVESGPGEFPTGSSITFEPDGDIAIRDGQAAIAFRAYHAGKTVIRATSPGLTDATIEVVTRNGPQFVPGKTLPVTPRPYLGFEGPRDGVSSTQLVSYGRQNPTRSSSEAADAPARFANDGDPKTGWTATTPGPGQWMQIALERFIRIHEVRVAFPNRAAHRYTVEATVDDKTWTMLVDRRDSKKEADSFVDQVAAPQVGLTIRVTVNSTAPNEKASIQEFSVLGQLTDR